MDNVIWVWGESISAAEPAEPPTLSVSAWAYLFNKKWLRWKPGEIPIEATTAKIAFVNTFHTVDSTHIEQIKQVNPTCFCIAMPDPCLDLVLSHHDWLNMYKQMKLADMIAGRTRQDCEVYGTMLNKPTVWLPSSIGPTDWFASFRTLTKEDYLLTLDHAFAPANTVCNVAVVAAVQRKTGCKVIYVAERDQTREYARLAGLEADFRGRVLFDDFVALTAKARLCVDMYASHSYGRQNVLCAMVGTFCVGSKWCTDIAHAPVDPFEIRQAVDVACTFWGYESQWRESRINEKCKVVEELFGFDASKRRVEKLIEKIKEVA